MSSSYDPFGLWAGPWFFMDLGLKFMRTWQEACYSRLKLNAAPQLFLPAMPRIPFARPDGERTMLEGEIAVRQGRNLPKLGCLTGVRVVGGPDVAAENKTAEKPVVEKAVTKPAAKSAGKPAVTAAAKPVAKGQAKAEPAAPAVEDTELPATTSVTSMLALQARSLSKAVAKAPKVEPAKAVVAKKAAAKPVAVKKAAAKPVLAKKPAAKPVAKAIAKPAVKPAAKTAVKSAAKSVAKKGSSKKA